MISTELFSDLKRLARADKLRIIEFLLIELATDEGLLLKAGLSYPVWTPYNSYRTAHQLLGFLRAEEQSSHG
jgi:hypothetical protein